MQLHWAPCAVATDGVETPTGLSSIGALQWSECKTASVVGTVRPMRSRHFDDLLSGFGIRRRGIGGAAAARENNASFSCPATPALCVTEGGAGDIELLPPEVTALPRSGAELCMAGYSSTADTAARRVSSSKLLDDAGVEGQVRSSWRQLCEPPDVIVFNLGASDYCGNEVCFLLVRPMHYCDSYRGLHNTMSVGQDCGRQNWLNSFPCQHSKQLCGLLYLQTTGKARN
jgi:hypothetical protein